VTTMAWSGRMVPPHPLASSNRNGSIAFRTRLAARGLNMRTIIHDGIYVIRTNLAADHLASTEVVRSYVPFTHILSIAATVRQHFLGWLLLLIGDGKSATFGRISTRFGCGCAGGGQRGALSIRSAACPIR
jgi:hypothetical protein